MIVRKQRKRILFCGEGQSERSYGRFIEALLEVENQSFTFQTKDLGGGSPLILVQRVKKYIEGCNMRQDEPFVQKVLLLDKDLYRSGSNSDSDALVIAQSLDLTLIWQSPCHEGFLLRHLPGCEGLKLDSSQSAKERLESKWPGYKKGLSASQLESKLTKENVLRAARRNHELASFLKSIGFL